jgi:hypothetical protein
LNLKLLEELGSGQPQNDSGGWVREMSMAEQTSEPPVITCTLAPTDLKARLAAIAELNAAALVSHRRDDLRLVLIYAAVAREQVVSMVRGERACCGFLTFEIGEERGGVRVTIDAPESARDAAESVFESFRSKTTNQVDCKCCGTVS